MSTIIGRLHYFSSRTSLEHNHHQIQNAQPTPESSSTSSKTTSPHEEVCHPEMVLIVGQPDRTCAAVAGIGMILSIMFSPALKRFFSQPIFVFFGSISFPLYLLHGIFIRGPLAWALFRLLPSLPWLPARDSKTLETLVVRRDCRSFICLSSALGICFIWFALLVLFCRFWKNRIDIYGVTLSKWGEEVVMGKRPFGTSNITTVTGTAMMELAKRLKGESSTTTSEKYGNGMLS
jgi:hypothetical protein